MNDCENNGISPKLHEEIKRASQRYVLSDDCYAHKADLMPDFEDLEWAFQTGAEWALTRNPDDVLINDNLK